MNRKKSDTTSGNAAKPGARKPAARKTATSTRNRASTRDGSSTAKPRRTAASKDRSGMDPAETVIPAGPETPLSRQRRSVPSGDGAPTEPGPKTVTVVCKADVGFGNALFIRGEGDGLSWESGVPLECRESDEWVWTAEIDEPVEFKLLLNDRDWSVGKNLAVAPGQHIECEPRFQ